MTTIKLKSDQIEKITIECLQDKHSSLVEEIDMHRDVPFYTEEEYYDVMKSTIYIEGILKLLMPDTEYYEWKLYYGADFIS